METEANDIEEIKTELLAVMKERDYKLCKDHPDFWSRVVSVIFYPISLTQQWFLVFSFCGFTAVDVPCTIYEGTDLISRYPNVPRTQKVASNREYFTHIISIRKYILVLLLSSIFISVNYVEYLSDSVKKRD